MSVEINLIGNVYVLSFDETFDMYSAPAIREDLVGFMKKMEAETDNPAVLFNFARVDYVDSSAIGVVSFFYNQCLKKSVTCLFVNLASHVRKVFSLTGFQFPICNSVEEGIQKITSKGA